MRNTPAASSKTAGTIEKYLTFMFVPSFVFGLKKESTKMVALCTMLTQA
jgi:hypothetical protein